MEYIYCKMKKFLNTILLISVLFLIFSSCSNYTQEELIGTYVNNYDELPDDIVTGPESPGKKDTLTLFKDGTFTSLCYGKGEYDIYYMINSYYIGLSYNRGLVSAGIDMGISSKTIFNKAPIFYINADKDYYYKKIK